MFLICSLICFLNERYVAIIHKYSLKTFSIYWVKVTDCTWLTCEHRHNTDTVYFLLFLMFFTLPCFLFLLTTNIRLWNRNNRNNNEKSSPWIWAVYFLLRYKVSLKWINTSAIPDKTQTKGKGKNQPKQDKIRKRWYLPLRNNWSQLPKTCFCVYVLSLVV